MTPNDSPAMAVGEALEWLRRLESDRTVVLRFSDEARATLAATRATFAAMAAEVEALRWEAASRRTNLQCADIAIAELRKDNAATLARAEAAEARCEELANAHREILFQHCNDTIKPKAFYISDKALNTPLAATRTTEGQTDER
jgi:hypothetical protein